MAEGLNGLNKRVKDTATGECYLTPQWAVSWLLEHWTPLGLVICDPSACGYGGWSIGQQVADTIEMRKSDGGVWSAAFELFDIDPKHPNVKQADFRTLSLSPTKGGRTIITNPPYNLLPEFVPWALFQPDVVEVVVLTRFGFLCAEQGRRARHLAAYLQPARRLAFGLLPEEGRRRVEHNSRLAAQLAAGEIDEKRYKKDRLDVHEDPRCLTGYRMSSTGVDHGWAVFRPGHLGPAALTIEAAEDTGTGTGQVTETETEVYAPW